MKYKTLEEDYLKTVAREIVTADYRSTHKFLKEFNKVILEEYLNDSKKGRKELAKKLKTLYKVMDDACEYMKEIRELCEPYNK